MIKLEELELDNTLNRYFHTRYFSSQQRDFCNILNVLQKSSSKPHLFKFDHRLAFDRHVP